MKLGRGSWQASERAPLPSQDKHQAEDTGRKRLVWERVGSWGPQRRSLGQEQQRIPEAPSTEVRAEATLGAHGG